MLLLSGSDGPSYSMDTSSLIQLTRAYPQRRFPELWRKILGLSAEFRLFTCEYVLREAKDPQTNAFINDHTTVVPFADFQYHLKSLMSALAAAGLNLTKTDVDRTEADPFVVALGLMLDGRDGNAPGTKVDMTRDGIVVTEESADKSHKIPAACRLLGLRSICFMELLEQLDYNG